MDRMAEKRHSHVCQSGRLPRRHWSRDCQSLRHRGRRLQCPPDVVEFGSSPRASWPRKSAAHWLFLVVAGTDVCFVSNEATGRPLTYGGIGLQFGDVVFHSRGERTHQRTDGEGQWGLISLPPEQLAACSKALTGYNIASPPEGRVLRPPRSAARRLLGLYSKICRLAETQHAVDRNPEVARALEQELLHALVNCLTAGDAGGNLKKRRHHTDIMVRFEDALAAHGDPHLNLPALCSAIGVPERTLRACCTEFLGMSPTRYHLLRRLNMARSALRRADPETTSVAEIARNHQFLELGRFAVAYRTVFGEMPSSTLRSPRIKTA